MVQDTPEVLERKGIAPAVGSLTKDILDYFLSRASHLCKKVIRSYKNYCLLGWQAINCILALTTPLPCFDLRLFL